MPIIGGKCNVMHVGDRNTKSNYSLLDNYVESVDQEEDHGVIINKDLKFTKQSI